MRKEVRHHEMGTSMDPHRLVASVPVMFPGAPLPTLGKPEAAQRESKADRLQRLLTAAAGPVLWANEIEQETGIKPDQLSKEIGRSPAVQTTMENYRWRLVSAKELGEPGRMKALHKEPGNAVAERGALIHAEDQGRPTCAVAKHLRPSGTSCYQQPCGCPLPPATPASDVQYTQTFRGKKPIVPAERSRETSPEKPERLKQVDGKAD
jgi:hypothetical protein